MSLAEDILGDATLALSPSTPPMLSMQQAAEHLGVTYRTIQRMVADGRLEHFRSGRIVRIPRSAIRPQLLEVPTL